MIAGEVFAKAPDALTRDERVMIGRAFGLIMHRVDHGGEVTVEDRPVLDAMVSLLHWLDERDLIAAMDGEPLQ